jgi:IS1 family transposase
MLDVTMRDLNCKRLQVDKIWGYVGKKQRHVTVDDDPRAVGDFWTFVAIDADSKLVPSFRVGKRTGENATAFMMDLASRMSSRVQLSSDALIAYIDAVDSTFGANVDYGQVVKVFESEPAGAGRYSPPKVVATQWTAIWEDPDPAHISTSYVERQNLSMRMSIRRLTRLTNGFSKKAESLQAAVALHFTHYNFVRPHRSLPGTPAMRAGIARRIWTLDDLLEGCLP